MLLTSDTIEALGLLAKKAKEVGWHVRFEASKHRLKDEYSLVGAGRECRIHIDRKTSDEPTERKLAALWSLAIPLEFTPLDRYPLSSETSSVFHFFGPWASLYERLCAEGRGHLAWPSVCAAAQSDVGVWAGSKVMERFVQSQLHRIGFNCGAIDGIIGKRTTSALAASGIATAPMESIADQLIKREARAKTREASQFGQITIPGRNLSVASFGELTTVKGPNGVSLKINGPGRVVVDVGETTT